ncbi:hypothetical protein, partial [Nocardia brasiliensis]|uniref:hypothetical protein n=1 Tax=Nocardia brasiliensis TaxID=37326 RepID=UPI001F230844
RGDPINFVTVLNHYDKLGIQKSIDTVATRVLARVEDHLSAARGLSCTMDRLGLATELQVAIQRCISDQQSWAAGMENWDRTGTIRFADAEVPSCGATASYVDDLLMRPALGS